MIIRNEIMEIIFEETGGLPYKQVEALQNRLDFYFRNKRSQGVNADKIINIVCNELEVTREEMMSKERQAKKVNARHVVSSMLRKHLGLSSSDVATLLDRDRTTVIHSCNVVDDQCCVDPKYKRKIDIINERIEKSWLS